MSNVLKLFVSDNRDVLKVSVSEGVRVIGGSITAIDGFVVKKGAGNVASTIEVGDYISGWIGDVYVAGKVTSIPVTDVSDLDIAVQGEIL